MKTLRTILILAAVLYPAHDVVPEQQLNHPWQPFVFGAPCSLKSDYEDGEGRTFAGCQTIEVRSPRGAKERKRRGIKK
ncbi:MAG TPA: hypothetical protein VIH29_12005 [Gallionella sp.]